MNNRTSISIGILLLAFGLILKSLFNHAIEYWVFINYSSLFLFVFGLSVLLISFLGKWNIKPKKEFKRTPVVWIVYFIKSNFSILFGLLVLIGLEKTGKCLNYHLRNYYLNSDTEITKGKIIDIVKIDLTKGGSEEFYLIEFSKGQKIIITGLLIDYTSWDNKNKSYKLLDHAISANKIKASKIDIMYSKNFPSFIKILE